MPTHRPGSAATRVAAALLFVLVPASTFASSKPSAKPPATGETPSPQDLSTALGILKNADLLVACEKGDAAEVRRILKEGASPNAARTSGATALQYAVAGHHTEVVKILLDAKADPNKDTFGLMPLFMAAENGDTDIVKMLLASGAKPNAPLHAVDKDLKVREGDTPLIASASEKGKAAVTKMLLAAGADVNAKAANGKTALLQAAASENLEVMKVLLDAKADLTARLDPPDDMDAMTIAIGKRRDDMVKLLLDHGADGTAMLDDEVSFLEFAIVSDQPKVAALLRKAGAKEPSKERVAQLRKEAAEALKEGEPAEP